ncbi:ethanolamine utilization protein EutN [Romboutsia ilealis]|uniref:EutN/CcmL family microcompartment protein n=1 Tax=Romboutsia faecis TaxID=2764597 RepID=A0ABR7JTG3_9FIRM|nr:EutN/CcmL family microcompartment protein [Romboutsia faecis]MBC5997926.1 EutN/CcmL family microcompartment protein [Romboutsia faecis]MRN25621.1 ethanolamine utilization protein EutN [Romboutsia ilealis]
MYLGKVVGTVVSTTKNEALVGFKLLVIKKLDEHLGMTDNSEVVVDSVGAGVGEIVLVSKGSSARYVLEREKAPIDSAVVAIVDTVEVNG